MAGELEATHVRFLTEAILRTASSLRDMANRIDRVSSEVSEIGLPGRLNYTDRATDVVRQVMWGVANLPLDRVIREASQADVARAKGE